MSAAQQRRSLAAQGGGETCAGGRSPPAQRAHLRLASSEAGQSDLPRAQLPRTRQGRFPTRQHSEIPNHLHARPQLARPARATHPAPKASETLDYEAELIFVVGKWAKHLTPA